jgi:hypothetical protein
MKKKIFKFTIISIILLIINPIAISCTVFHVSNDNYAFGGNNEDYNDPDTHIYFYPPTEETYGKVIVGYTGLYRIQGGMNEKGLFWDGLATPYLEVVNSSDKPYFNGHIVDFILDTCETCDEALGVFDQYNLQIFENAQILMGDKYGDSFVIEGDVIHRKDDYYQVATNFYLSQYPNPPYPCWRYNTALDMFENNPIEDLSVDFCASVLEAVHQEGAYPTLYSNVYDLKNGLIYLYSNHNFNNVKIFNLEDEFELGYHSYSIPELFEDESIPPYKPNIIGPISGETGISYDYTFNSIDPDDDAIQFIIQWGDNIIDERTEYIGSGENITISHTWDEEDTYTIRVKAKDINDAESDWATLEVSMPKSKSFNLKDFLTSFLDDHPLMFPVLGQLIGLY